LAKRGLGGVNVKFIRNNPKLKPRRRELRCNQTDTEKILWERLRNKRFYGIKFYRQYSMGMYIIDFYCPTMKLAIELDGGQHADDENREYDEERSDYLRANGIEVIRFWNNEVLQNIDGVLIKIAGKITPPIPPLNLRGG
jgi:very-short-patch-repair endonuclease